MNMMNINVKYFLGKNEVSLDEASRNIISSIGYKQIYDKKGGY